MDDHINCAEGNSSHGLDEESLSNNRTLSQLTVSNTTTFYYGCNITVLPTNIYREPPMYEVILVLIVQVLMILFNVPVFIVVPRLSNLKNTGKIMISLACTDVALGAQSLVRFIINYIKDTLVMTDESIDCKIDAFMNIYFASVSIIHMTFINLDKMLSIQFPFKYQQVVTPFTVNIILISIWGLLFFFYIPVFFGLKVKMYPSLFVCIMDFRNNIPYAVTFNIITCISYSGHCSICCSHIRSSQEAKEPDRKPSEPTQNCLI